MECQDAKLRSRRALSAGPALAGPTAWGRYFSDNRQTARLEDRHGKAVDSFLGAAPGSGCVGLDCVALRRPRGRPLLPESDHCPASQRLSACQQETPAPPKQYKQKDRPPGGLSEIQSSF